MCSNGRAGNASRHRGRLIRCDCGMGAARRSCYPLYIVGFFLCIVEMKPKTRILLTWWYTIILAGVLTGVLIKQNNNQKKFTASPTDMKKLDVSPTFCDSVIVKSTYPIVVMTFNSEPQIGDDFTVVHRRVSTTLGNNEYQYWGYYLLKGSVITANVCGQVHLYTIVGKENFDDWLNGHSGDKGDRILTKPCDASNHFSTTIVNRTATKSEEYYFVFLNPDNIMEAVDVKVDFQIRRKYYMYNFDDNTTRLICDSKDCTVPLEAKTSESVVIYVPKKIEYSDFEITTLCKPRVYIYVLILGILPFLIGSILTCVILKCTSKQNTDTTGNTNDIFTVSNSENDRQSGVDNPNFRLQLAPPSYEEVQALYDAPPTYQEAVNARNDDSSIDTNDNTGQLQ